MFDHFSCCQFTELMHAFIFSCLDYWNALYCSVLASVRAHVTDPADWEHILIHTEKHEHSIPVPAHLNWPPDQFHIDFTKGPKVH